MKIILSRKGFDSVSGGFPSPIMPDGTLLSMPIPEAGSNMRYEELNYNCKNYEEILNELKGNKNLYFGKCHLDPDIRKDVFKPDYHFGRHENWKPSFGQKGSSLTHLRNKGIAEGDLFLFFGLFREAEIIDGKYRFVKGTKEKHIIWGYLQIDEIINPNIEKYPWLGRHPHLQYQENNNAIFVAREKLSWDKHKEGSGCLKFNENLVLTKNGLSSSCWELPDFLLETEISYHTEKHRKDGYFQSVARGQEFVFSADERLEILKWISDIIGSNHPRESRYRITPELINQLDPDEIFVFGSNLEGKHGGGAARTALKWGAIMGVGEGIQGKTYAIPTMFDSVEEINPYVIRFIDYAKRNSNKRFLVTKIGCGIAGYNSEQIAPLFLSVIRENISNICLPEEWTTLLVSFEGIGKD